MCYSRSRIFKLKNNESTLWYFFWPSIFQICCGCIFYMPVFAFSYFISVCLCTYLFLTRTFSLQSKRQKEFECRNGMSCAHTRGLEICCYCCWSFVLSLVLRFLHFSLSSLCACSLVLGFTFSVSFAFLSLVVFVQFNKLKLQKGQDHGRIERTSDTSALRMCEALFLVSMSLSCTLCSVSLSRRYSV